MVTKDNVDYCLSIIKDEENKKFFMNSISKFDIRISTKPVIEGEEFYYKILIWIRVTNQRTHFKLYSRLELLKEEKAETILPILIDLLKMIRRSLYLPDECRDYYEVLPVFSR